MEFYRFGEILTPNDKQWGVIKTLHLHETEGEKTITTYPITFASKCLGVFTSIDFGTYSYNTRYNDWQITTENTSKSGFTISTCGGGYILVNTKISWFSIGV